LPTACNPDFSLAGEKSTASSSVKLGPPNWTCKAQCTTTLDRHPSQRLFTKNPGKTSRNRSKEHQADAKNADERGIRLHHGLKSHDSEPWNVVPRQNEMTATSGWLASSQRPRTRRRPFDFFFDARGKMRDLQSLTRNCGLVPAQKFLMQLLSTLAAAQRPPRLSIKPSRSPACVSPIDTTSFQEILECAFDWCQRFMFSHKCHMGILNPSSRPFVSRLRGKRIARSADEEDPSSLEARASQSIRGAHPH